MTGTPRTSPARRSARWERWNGPGWRDAVDWVEAELGNLRAGYRWSAARGDLDGRDRHRRPRRADGVLGAAVRDARVGRGAARAARPRPTSAGSPASTPPPGTRASRDGPRPRARTRTEPPSSRPTPATTRASPATRRSSRRWAAVYCGDLDRYVELTGDGGATRTGRDRGYGLSSYVDGLQSARPDRGGARAHRGVGRGRANARQPVLDLVRAVDRGHGVLQGRRARALAAWDEGVAFVREHRVQFFEGFLARDAARLHTSDGEPDDRAGAVRRCDHRVPTRRQRAAAGHHPRQRAGAVRAARPARRRRRCCSARCRTSRRASTTSPSSPRSANASPPSSGTRAAELTAGGAALDLGDAAVYARQQIDVARRDPTSGDAGAAGRPEPPRDRGAPARGRRPTAGEIATQLFISSRTAEHHIQNIYTKIGVSNRAAATRCVTVDLLHHRRRGFRTFPLSRNFCTNSTSILFTVEVAVEVEQMCFEQLVLLPDLFKLVTVGRTPRLATPGIGRILDAAYAYREHAANRRRRVVPSRRFAVG